MAFPFDLPAISRGYADLTPEARAIGAEAAQAAARALSALLAREVTVHGRAMPGAAAPRSAAARLDLHLGAVPAQAVLEVEPALVVRLVDVLAGGPGAADGATALTPVEAAALELFALAALDGACAIAAVEGGLAPRLVRGDVAAEPGSGLVVDLEVRAGHVAGRARLVLTAPAVRALRGPAGPVGGAAAALSVPISVRSGGADLLPTELDALAPGDVVLVDPPADGRDALVIPGGARLRGRLDDDGFHVEEMAMTDRNAKLPVTLEVELARVEIPLGALARLEPGTILPLGVDRRGLVTLRAAERAVARGELVDVDGAVGVRVLSVEVGP
jgi:type III secretion protein Q